MVPLPLRQEVKKPQLRDVWSLLSESATEWMGHNAPRLGAALAFYTLLSVAPLLSVIAAIGGMFFGSDKARVEITRQVYNIAGHAGAKVVSSILGATHEVQHGIIATLVGAIVLFFGASGVLIELREALNTMWDIDTNTKTPLEDVLRFVRERLFAFMLVLSIGFMLLLMLSLQVMADAVLEYAPAMPSVALHLGAGIVSFIVITGLFAAIFKFIPDRPLDWRDVLLGAVVTSLLFAAGRYLIAFYLARASYNTLYGSAASTTALLVWVYYSSQIFFFGAAFTKVFAKRFGSAPPTGATRAEVS